MAKTCILITAGQGPSECALFVSQLLPLFVESAQKAGHKLEIIHREKDKHHCVYRSVLILLEGNDMDRFLSQWLGTIQWIANSPYRPHHKRRNWFIGLFKLPELATSHHENMQFKIETMRASGPGGQHVNKTDSAIRITHIASGLSAIAQESRSQIQNKHIAHARLLAKLQQAQEQSESQFTQLQRQQHRHLERGNPIRVYKGEKLQLKW